MSFLYRQRGTLGQCEASPRCFSTHHHHHHYHHQSLPVSSIILSRSFATFVGYSCLQNRTMQTHVKRLIFDERPLLTINHSLLHLCSQHHPAFAAIGALVSISGTSCTSRPCLTSPATFPFVFHCMPERNGHTKTHELIGTRKKPHHP